jgi:2-(1,2-epoxy-1,2-dihydrophenyl)acetyl-CoA isomerase
MTQYAHIQFDVSADVAAITLNRPEKLNALATQTLTEIGAALDEAVAKGARAILLSGAGRAFCSGADLADPTVKGDLGLVVETYYNPVIRKLSQLQIPVVCAVRGAAAGAGCSLALHADFVVAGRSAYFLLAFVNIALVPDAGATWLVAQALGRARALEMAMLGERLPAEFAKEAGLIHKVVDDEAVLDEARALAERLARGPTKTLGMIRRLMNAALTSDLPTALEAERQAQTPAGFSRDSQEAIAAFIEKRPATFTGN